MKRKLLTFFSLVLTVCVSLFVFTACDGVLDDKQNAGNGDTPTHTHAYNTLKYDAENHWHECSCGEKSNEETHSGGVATETERAVCSVCNQEYGTLLGHTHAYNTLKYDAENHWHECSCGEKSNEETHSGGTATETERAVCSVCNQEYGTTIVDNGIEFTTLSVEGTTVYGKVSNYIEEFSLDDEINCSGDVDFVVSLDENRTQIIENNTIPLIVGDNVLYVTELVNEIPTKVYNVTIRRKPLYSVTFTMENGTPYRTYSVEEDGFITDIGVVNKLGITFNGWDYDFSKPVTSDIIIRGLFVISPEMKIFNFTSSETTCVITSLRYIDTIHVTIPSYVTEIKDYAFRDRIKIESVFFEENSQLKTIGKYAFDNCSSLKNITFVNNDKLEKISDYAFTRCGAIKSIEIPNCVTTLGNSAFYKCIKLQSITFEENSKLTEIKSDTFKGCESLYSIEIPKGVCVLYDAFAECSSLTSIIIPETITSMDVSFFNCPKISTIAVNKNNQVYKSIEGKLYSKNGETLIRYPQGSTSKSFIIPNGVLKIEEYAFDSNSHLTSIEIPNTVKTIGKNAFVSCYSLTSVQVPNSVTSIGEGAFFGCSSLESITLPFVGATLDGEENTNFSYIFNPFGYIDDLVPSSLKKVVITGGTFIDDHAFYHCSSIERIELPDSITSIKGDHAFYGCYSLKYNIKDGLKYLGNSNNEYLCLIEQEYTNRTSYSIDNNCKVIADRAFGADPNILSIEISKSVKYIGHGALSGCIALETIIFNGTIDEWNAIIKGSSWNYGVPATFVQCLDDKVNL